MQITNIIHKDKNDEMILVYLKRLQRGYCRNSQWALSEVSPIIIF